jgi:hypothetical protein
MSELETIDKFYDFQTILSGELLWKIIVKIKMHSSITKMTSALWITVPQITPEQQRCPNVSFINGSKEYHSTVGQGLFHK